MKRFFLVWLLVVIYSPIPVRAQSLMSDTQETEIWGQHFTEIVVPLNFLSEDLYQSIRNKYICNSLITKSLRRLCYECERRKYLYNYLHLYPKDRFKLKEKIDSIYQDSINALLIPANQAISGPLISITLNMSDVLGLDSTKYNAMMNKALSFARIKKQYPCQSFAKEEIEVLKENLSRKQIEKVIKLKNITLSHDRAQSAWSALSKANVVEPSDSADYVSLAFSYYQLEAFIFDYYLDEPDVIDNNLRDLYTRKPQVIKMYEALYNKEAIKQNHQKKVGVEYAW